MERFVFVAAVAIAVLYGMWSFWGAPNISWSDDIEFGRTDAVVQVSSGHTAASYTVNEIDVRAAAAVVTVTPEDRQDVTVEITNPGHLPMLEPTVDGGKLTLDGHLRNRVQDCMENGGARVRGYGTFTADQLPQIVIHMPRDVRIGVGGGSTTTIGDAQSVDAEFRGCGSARIGNVAQELKVEVSGSGHVIAGTAQSLNAELAGSGELETAAIANGAEIDVAGSGEVSLASLNGSLKADGAGSGTLNIRDGALTTAEIDMAGSGDANIAATIQHLKVDIVGSGDLDVTKPVVDVDADLMGAGTVNLVAATGRVNRSSIGPGASLNIGR